MSGSGSAQELAGGIIRVKAETLNAERAIANSKTTGNAANRIDAVKTEMLKAEIGRRRVSGAGRDDHAHD